MSGKEVAVLEPHESVELAPREKVGGLMRPVAGIDQIIQNQEETRDLIQRALKPNRDYGVIPGTDRSTLLKPGGERVLAAYGCFPRFSIVDAEVDHDRSIQWSKNKWVGWGDNRRREQIEGQSFGLYRYVMKCELIHRETGIVIGMGHGIASTMEDRYVENPRSVENTVLKIAEKRSMIDAVLTTFGLSDQFTQDVEDMAREENGGRSKPANGNASSAKSERPARRASDRQISKLRHEFNHAGISEVHRQQLEARIAGSEADPALLTSAQASQLIDWAKGQAAGANPSDPPMNGEH